MTGPTGLAIYSNWFFPESTRSGGYKAGEQAILQTPRPTAFFTADLVCH